MKRTRDIIFISCFLLLLAAPQVIKVFNIKVDTGNSEKRVLKPAPHFNFDRTIHASGPVNIFQEFIEDISTYKQQYDEYYTNNFRLKNNMFDLYVATKRSLLQSNPIPGNVMEGRDGWFFLGDSYCDIMLEYTALKQFSQEQVDSLNKNLLDMAAYLKEKQIGFYVVIAPDKQNIYGQFLPLQKRAGKLTKLEQIKAANRNNDYQLLDLADALNSHQNIRLYHKTDTHWNDYGAFIGFQAVMKMLQKDYPQLEMLSIQDFKVDTVTTYQRDLTEMLRLKIREDEIRFTYAVPEYAVLQQPQLSIPDNNTRNAGDYETRYSNGRKKLKIMFFRDSFSGAWKKYFKECFGTSLFISDYVMSRALIEKEAPDIVIYEKVQRDIDGLLTPATK